MEPPKPLCVLRGHEEGVSAVNFHSRSNSSLAPLILSGDTGGSVKIWDMKTRRVFASTRAHSDGVLNVLHATGKAEGILSHGKKGDINLWDLGQGSLVPVWQKQVGGIAFCKCALSEGDHLLALPAEDPSDLCLFDMDSKKTIATLNHSTDSVGMCMTVKFIRNESGVEQLLAGYENGCMILWDIKERRELWISKRHESPVLCMGVDSSRNNIAISGSTSNELHIGQIQVGNLEKSKKISLKHEGINCISFRNDYKLLATGGWDHRTRIFRWAKMTPLAILDIHTGAINDISWSSADSGNLLAVASKDRRISIWSLYNSNKKSKE
eukprot:m.42162 g.42162  ORF g.42162 m.42162 type:complete len:325 (+) comp9850_c0_seq2:141-1115(+)